MFKRKAPPVEPAKVVEEGEEGEKPLPTPRPGTSGTELVLRSNRQTSYEAWKKAHQAEMAYRSRKQAQQAKSDCLGAKTELREAASHFKKGFCFAVGGVKALPAVVRAKREEAREKRAQREREDAIKKRERWEKKLKDAEEAEKNKPEVPAKDGEEGEETAVA